MYLRHALIILAIGPTLVLASVISSVIEVRRNFSDYLTLDDTDNTTQPMVACSSGTLLVPAAAEEKKDACAPCPNGHFMPEENHRWKQCRPCYTPDWALGEVEGQPCNSTKDTAVSCRLDYFLQENRCTNCRKCSFNDSRSTCVASCCRARVNSTGGAQEGVDIYDCGRYTESDYGSNDWRIIFLVGLLGITVFIVFICVWRGVFKNGNRAGKAGCIRYKRVRTLSNSL